MDNNIYDKFTDPRDIVLAQLCERANELEARVRKLEASAKKRRWLSRWLG